MAIYRSSSFAYVTADNVFHISSILVLLIGVAVLRPSGTAQGGLAQLIADSRATSRAPSEAGDIDRELLNKDIAVRGKKKSRKAKKTKSKKKGGDFSTAALEKPDFLLPQALRSASKATLKERLSAVPVASGGVSQVIADWEFIKKPVSSVPSSATSSPPRSGLSSMLNQCHPGDIVSPQSSSTSTASDSERTESMIAYEVAIAQDFVAEDADSRPQSRCGRPLWQNKKKITAEDFEQLKCLGKGAYGTVTLVQHKETGKLYAQKQLKKASLVVHKKVIEQTKTERSILESVRHPNVVKLFYAFQDHEKLYLILEYAQGGELFHHLAESRMFCEDTASFYIAQLVLALSHLHMNVGVVYRDLKPENCLLDADGNLLLTDFGLSKVRTDDERCRSFLGTPGYMAPEILSGDGKEEYGAEVDWWGVGILTFELLTGKTPFEGNSPEKVKAKIQNRKLALPSYLTLDAKDLITKLLRKQPEKRLGFNMEKDLPYIKSHRFFRKINWGKLERREIEPPIRPLVTDPLLAENFCTDFTELPLSPVTGPFEGWPAPRKAMDEHFKGFSFTAVGLLEQQFMAES
ncbi:kinase-like domain-containing protein [Geopyxis carbonaria]|nr:kinase-like domain-containing protein [Geopyxis carbonaria]